MTGVSELNKDAAVLPMPAMKQALEHSLTDAPKPFNACNIKVLLLEGVNQTGIKILTNAGYQVEAHAKALPEALLKEKIKDVHAIGIRSKTQLTADVLKEAKKLMAVGCFCIGTNQVDLEYAASHGISVFNSPFSNSRSVAEMAIAEIIALSRQLGDRNTEMHNGIWNKTSSSCKEFVEKYSALLVMIMPLGTAKRVSTLKELLSTADFVTLHVPETDETKNMIGEVELALMRKGTYLINASRGTVVDILALKAALVSGHLAGAAVDVYPVEPFTNGKHFESELIGCPNTLLTPHIGGSTEEAQSSIGVEVGSALTRFINSGSTLGAVNFPEADIRSISMGANTVRVINCHHNVPGVLKQINRILSKFNIEKQICDSKGSVAYLMADILVDSEKDLIQIFDGISAIPENISTRLLYQF
ncbi:hypothetical protein BASA61_007100 [Batrachochytrium salamandrivorans]|nr:hypothetical protein BASA61_007100 [Batrachochytrium salamandrivorans]